MKKKNAVTVIKGFKVFDVNMKCRGFQFEVGKEYAHEGKVEVCASGFHFCEKAAHVFSYYDFDPKNRVCEVEGWGDEQKHEEDSKVAVRHLRIVRELKWEEVLFVANEGLHNTGHSNTGNSNTGDSNTGNWNTGNRNTGNSNTGDRNTGYSNTGNRNTGDSNTGNRNTGDRNTGYSNTGDSNTGYSNTGYSNTGYSNTGDRNTGNWNTGNWNTGNWNTGNWNTGYSNTGDRNTGAFCTEEPPFPLFDKPSKWTAKDFENSQAYKLLCQIHTKMWIQSEAMTEEEKKTFPSHSTCGGYLKDIPFKEAFMNAWHNWNEENRKAFTSLPNFNKKKFFEITGVKL